MIRTVKSEGDTVNLENLYQSNSNIVFSSNNTSLEEDSLDNQNFDSRSILVYGNNLNTDEKNKVNNSRSSILFLDKTQIEMLTPHYELEEFIEEFINTAYEDNFEFGYISKTENYVKHYFKEYPSVVKEWLSDAFLRYYDNTYILSAILHVISHIKYDLIKPYGPLMAIAAISHEDIEVREYAIRAFENWGNINSLKVLRSIKCEEAWLQEYVSRIIDDLEEEIGG